LDHFKQVNDTYGHLVGSQTLEEVGALITRALRAGDVAARFGGEEFAAFLLDADGAQALVAAERVRTTIAAHTFAAVRREAVSADEPVPTFNVTISVGVAAFPQDARDPIELMELADTALYRAKQTGRNRTIAYAPTNDSAARALPSRNAPRAAANDDDGADT
jgi:diguanylate cyclase (GGDEF)-like protein